MSENPAVQTGERSFALMPFDRASDFGLAAPGGVQPPVLIVPPFYPTALPNCFAQMGLPPIEQLVQVGIDDLFILEKDTDAARYYSLFQGAMLNAYRARIKKVTAFRKFQIGSFVM